MKPQKISKQLKNLKRENQWYLILTVSKNSDLKEKPRPVNPEKKILSPSNKSFYNPKLLTLEVK